MFCPRCSQEFTNDVVYCRACGLELGDVTAIVLDRSGSTPPPEKFKPNTLSMRIGIGLFILGLVIALANAAIGGLTGIPVIYGQTVFMFMVVAGLICLGIGFVFPEKRSRRKRKVHGVESAGATTSQLRQLQDPAVVEIDRDEPLSHQPASVTENTTRNLG